MSKDKKKEKTPVNQQAANGITPIVKQSYVVINLPPNPSEADKEKAIREIITKTEFNAVPGTNNLRGIVHACIFNIDNDYQRHDPNDTRSVKAKLNADNFDNSKCIEIVCSWRDGKLQVIDGASRLLAGLAAGQTYFAVIIINGFDGLTKKEEAGYYITQDDNKVNMNFYSIHKAALQHEETAHLLLQKYYNMYNLEIGKPSKYKVARYLSSPKVVMQFMLDLQNKHGKAAMEQFAEWFFAVYKRAGWIDTDPETVSMGFQAHYTAAIGELFVNEYPNEDSDKTLALDGPIMTNLVTNLRKLTPNDIYTYATEYQNAIRNSGPRRRVPEIRKAIRYTISGLATNEITWNQVINLAFNNIY